MTAALQLAVLLTIGFPAAVTAVSVPPGFTDEQIASGFHEPVGLMFLPSGCLVSIEASGTVRPVAAPRRHHPALPRLIPSSHCSKKLNHG